MKRICCWLLCAVLCLSVAACKKNEDTPENKLFYCYLSADPVSLDPQVASDDAAKMVLESLFEGLVRLNGDGLAEPGVAEKWESDADSTVFTFYLRRDAEWSDGSPVTADDFVFAMQRAVDPQTRSTLASQLFCILNAEEIHAGAMEKEQLGVEALDSYTLRITLAYSYDDFPSQTARSVFFPCSRSFFESTGGKYGMEGSQVLGNGAFALRKKSGWIHNSYLRLVRNEFYAGEHAAVPSGVLFTVKTVADPLAAMEEYKADVIAIGEDDVQQAEESGLAVKSFTDTTWGLCFNTADELFSNVSVRRALMLSLSRNSLYEALPNNCTRADNMIPPETSYMGKSYRSAAGSCALPQTDLAAARQALSQALVDLGRNKLPAVTVLCRDDEETKIAVNTMLGEWRSALGYYFNLEAVSQETLEKRVAAGTYQLALVPVRAGEDGPQSFLSAVCSLAQYRSEEYDALALRLYSDTVAAAKEAETLLLNEAVFYPMYYQNQYYAMANTVTGLVIHPFGGIIDFNGAGKLNPS
ncbi:MAG: peptide ABC transporter substrate-binding protein [Firmicutes bacterium]|nr:peptide ABC transporter substrate-binding protein [Bacillota bacterium]